MKGDEKGKPHISIPQKSAVAIVPPKKVRTRVRLSLHTCTIALKPPPTAAVSARKPRPVGLASSSPAPNRR